MSDEARGAMCIPLGYMSDEQQNQGAKLPDQRSSEIDRFLRYSSSMYCGAIHLVGKPRNLNDLEASMSCHILKEEVTMMD